MPDTAPAPGSTPAASGPAASATTTPGSVTAPVTPAAESLDTLLQRERAARIAAEQRYAESQRFIGRQTTEIGNLRRQVSGGSPESPFMGDGSGAGTATERAGGRPASLSDDPVYEHDRKTRDFRDFLRDSGLSPERRAKFLEIAADPARSSEFAIKDAYNRIDYYRSYAAIADRLELDEFRAARAAAAGGAPQATAPSASPAGLPRTAGMLSGTSSVVAPGPPIDLAGASADDLLTKGGLAQFADPNDLPSALRR